MGKNVPVRNTPNSGGGEEEAFINHGRDRDLWNWCSGCTGGAPRGTFCFTVCGGRRRLEQGTEKTGLRHLQSTTGGATMVNGYFTSGEGTDAGAIASAILDCLSIHSAENPCLGSTDAMTLNVITVD
jgi:hypothetical protein